MLVSNKVTVRTRAKSDLMSSTALAALVIGALGFAAGPVLAQSATDNQLFWDAGDPISPAINPSSDALPDPDGGEWNISPANDVWVVGPGGTAAGGDAAGDVVSWTNGYDAVFAPGLDADSGLPAGTVTIELTEQIRPDTILFEADPLDQTEYVLVEQTPGGNQVIRSDASGGNGSNPSAPVEIIMNDAATIAARLNGDFIIQGTELLTLDFFTSNATQSFTVESGAQVLLVADGRVGGATSVSGLFTNSGRLATVDVESGGTLELVDGRVDEDVEVEVGGVLTSDGDSSIVTTLDNAGTATVQTGTLSVDGQVTNTAGTLTVDGGATLEAASGVDVVGGDMVVVGEVDGDIDTTNGDLALNAGTVTGQVDIGTGSEFDSTGVSTINQTLENAGTATVTSGTLTVDGGVTTTDGSLAVADTATLDADVQVNGGALNLNGGAVTAATVDGAVTVGTSGDMTTDGISTITQTLENAGTTTVQSGTLTVDGDVTTTDGTMTVAEDATLVADVQVDDGAFNMDGGVGTAAVTGAVTVAVDGAMTTDGAATISETLENEGTTLVSTDTLTVTGLVTNADGTLTVGNGATLEALADVLVTGGTVTVSGVLDGAQTTVQDGLLDFITGEATGDVDIQADGALDSTGNTTIQGALDFAGTGGVSNNTLTVNGAVTQTGGTLTVAGPSANLNATSGVAVDGGTLDVQATVTGAVTADTTGVVALTGGVIDGTLDILADGELTSADDSEITGDLETSGAVVVNSGTLLASGEALVTGGTVLVNTDGTLQADGVNGLDIVGGTVTVLGQVTGAVTADTTGELALEDGGQVDGAVDVAATGVFTSEGAAIVTGVLTNDGAATVTGGDLTADAGVVNQGTGVLTLAGGATLSTTASVDVNGGQFNASGTVDGDVDLAANMTLGNSAEITGTLTVEGTGVALANGGEVAVVDNQGTFNLGNTNTVTITDSFDNSGTVDAVNNQAATLAVANTFSSTGLIDGGTAVLAIQAGLIDLNAGTTLAGAIQFLGDIDNAIVLTFDGSYDLAGVLTNEATGVVTFAGPMSTSGFDVVNEAGGLMTVAADVTTAGGDVINQGTMTVAAGVDLTVATLSNVGGAAQLQVDGALSGDVQNDASGDVTVAATGAVDGTLENAGAAVVAGTVADIENAGTGTLTLTGTPTVTGDLQNEGTASVAAGAVATVNGETQNQASGDLTVVAGGTLVSDVVNSGTATLTVDGTVIGAVDNGATMDTNGTVNGTVANAGDMTLAGTVTGALNNQSAGMLVVDGASTVGAALNNAGTAEVASGQALTVSGPVTNQSGGSLTLADTSTLNGDVTNQSGATLALEGGTLDGALTNDAGGTVTNAMDSTVTGELATRGTLEIDSGTLTVTGVMNSRGNSDTMIATGATLNAQSGLTHSGTGLLDVQGTLLGDLGVASDAFVDLNGGAIGALGDLSMVRNNGTFSMGGDVFGDLSNLDTGILMIDEASSVSGAFVNEANVMAMADISYGSANNTGAFRIDPGVTLSGSMFTNSGAITSSGAVTVDGGLTSTGTISMLNGSLDDSFAIIGNANLGGTTINIDADLEPGSANSDTISVTGGALTGNLDLQFNLVGIPTNELDMPLTVLTYDTGEANSFSFNQDGLPLVGSILFVLDDTGTGAVNVDSIQNPALGGLASAVTLTQSLIGSVVNRPSSPFVAGLAVADSQPCGVGAWGRATGGPAEATGTTSAQTSSGTNYSFGSELSADYYGVQFGGDFSCFDGYYNGWDLSFGGIGGINIGSTVQPVFLIDGTSGTVFDDAPISNNFTDFTQVYAGAYVSAFRNNLLLDLQYRFERTAFDLTNDGEGALRLGILDQTFNSRAQTLSGSAGYAVPLSEALGITFVPTLGFAITSTTTDTINFEDGAFLEIDDSTSQVGFVGASVSRSVFLPDNVSALTYFATGTVYNDFADDVRSVYFDTPTSAGEESFSSNLGTYGELSVGANYTRVLTPGGAISPRQFNASARLDARFGESLDSWGLTGQVRYQF